MNAAEVAEAVAAWGGTGAAHPIKDRENAVYRIALARGAAALRLHRPGYQSAGAIVSELWWMAALAEAGFGVPRPCPDADDHLVRRLSTGRLASVVTWEAGVPLGAAGLPLNGTISAQSARFRAIGALLAQLHRATDRLALPSTFERPDWDAEALLGPNPRWGRFWENPALHPAEAAELARFRDIARDRLARMPRRTGDFGLIHADLMRENLLIDGARVTLIDFDDSGFGYRLYDLGTLMIQNLDEPAYEDLLAAAAEGYFGAAPGTEILADLRFFVTLRCLASCGWAVPRMAPEDPALRRYAERALSQARAFCAHS